MLARALGGNRVEPFLRQVLIELVRRHVDNARMTLITNHREPGGRTNEAGRIAAVASDDRLADGSVHDDEVFHQLRIARNWITEELLADSQTNRDDIAWNG